MNDEAAPDQQVLRKLLRSARQIRSRLITSDRRLQLRDVYSICYHIVRELDGRYPDLRIMVGDRATEHGPVQHMWLEIPSGEIYLDAAYDALDPFQPIRAGRTSDPDFLSIYRNAQDANVDVNDPRNRPELMFKTKSAWDSEA